MIEALRQAAGFLRELARSQHRDQLLVRAAALAYTTLLSLVPLMTVALVTVGRVQPERAEQVVRGVAAVLPFSPARIQATLTLLAERTAALGSLAIVLSAAVTLHLFYQIEEVINTIWGLPHRRRWQWRLVSFLMVLLWGPLLLTALFSTLYWIYSLPGVSQVAPLIRPLPAIFAVLTLTAVYRWVPHTRVPWRAALTGAFVATLFLASLHYGFQAYVTFASELNVIYGSLSLLLFFLVSLFLFWLSILLGAEASWVVGHRPAPLPRTHADEVLAALAETAHNGALSFERVEQLLGERSQQVFRLLATPPAIVQQQATGWRLARPPDDVTVGEVLERLAVPSGEGRWSDDTTLATVVKQSHGSSPGELVRTVEAAGPRH